MNLFTPSMLRRIPAMFPAALLVAMILASGSITLQAQSYTSVGNEDIAVHAVDNPKSGRFWITGGTHYRDTLKFLYASGPSFVTSNIVFRVKRGNQTRYFGNLPPNSAPSQKPKNPETGGDVEYRAYDSMVKAPTGDTLSIYWNNLDGYDIVLRFMPEKRRTEFDRGSDMLMEFQYTPDPLSPPGELGILMMLDVYNNNAVTTSGGGTGDGSSIMTSSGYYPSRSVGRKFLPPFDQIPEWYQVGNFTTGLPLNTIYPIHRLRDTSHGGHQLTTPNLFAIGHWPDFRLVGWELPSNIATQIVTDGATITRWDTLKGEGKVVTAFGLSDREGNDMFTCRDSSLFVSIRTKRLLEQVTPGAPYSSPTFDVEMWVANTDSTSSRSVTITLLNPIITTPLTAGRLVLDPSTPNFAGLQLAPGQTGKVTWKLVATPGGEDDPDTVDAQLQFRYNFAGQPVRNFKQLCFPTITLRDFHTPKPPVDRDTMPPIVRQTATAPYPAASWDFEAFDRHAGYRLDSGIEKIVVDQTMSTNIGFEMSGGRQCDTTSTYRPHFVVIDHKKPGAIYFDVFDCAGNITRDSALYLPPADTMAPLLTSDSGGTSVSTYWDVDIVDRHPGFHFDTGVDKIVVDNARTSNFGATIQPGARCDTLAPLKVRFNVVDNRLAAKVYFDAFDCMGNSISDSIIYQGRQSAVDEEITSGYGLLIESVAPNPVVGSGATVLVTLRNPVAGRVTATLVTIDGIEIPCSLVEPAGDLRLRITLPPALASGQYQLRIGGEKGIGVVGLRYVR